MTRMTRTLAIFLSGAPFLAGAAEPKPQITATAAFVNSKGQTVGTATLTQSAGGVLIEAKLSGLPPGVHAFHVHAVGKCEPATEFKSAGDHYAPRRKTHGFHAEGGPHSGDMPNQHVPSDGVLRVSVLNAEVTLTPGEATLFDTDGSSLVLHAKEDDYRTQPSGDAGGRIACGVVRKKA
jgi:superoxide dismutase, Cu-Zn family